MNIQELLKFQIMSKMTTGQQSNEENDTTAFLYTLGLQCLTFAMIGMIDETSKRIPEILSFLKKKYLDTPLSLTFIENKDANLSDTSLKLSQRSHVSHLQLMRTYDSSRQAETVKMNELVDAVIDQISRLPNVPSMMLNSRAQFLVNYLESSLQLTDDIFVRVDRIEIEDTGVVKEIHLTLSSNTLTATDLADHVKELYKAYRVNLDNSLGNKIYFFNQTLPKPMGDMRGAPGGGTGRSFEQEKKNKIVYDILNAPKHLSFTMMPFHSNKTFDNICGTEARKVHERVDFFLKNKEWYAKKGIPYQLGILLSGVPGSGKTSILRAVATKTRRHIINVNFSEIKTVTQMRDLFFSQEITVEDGDKKQVIMNIPHDKRLYVLEELDAVGDLLHERLFKDETKLPVVPDQLTLGEVLSIIDGTIEFPGRIIIMTSNYPEKLDKALIRPGRIDLALNFGCANQETIHEMYQLYFDRPLQYEYALPTNLTPAELSFILFSHFNTRDDDRVVQDMVTKSEENSRQEQLEQEKLERIQLEKRLVQEEVARKQNEKNDLREKMMTQMAQMEREKEKEKVVHIDSDSDGM